MFREASLRLRTSPNSATEVKTVNVSSRHSNCHGTISMPLVGDGLGEVASRVGDDADAIGAHESGRVARSRCLRF